MYKDGARPYSDIEKGIVDPKFSQEDHYPKSSNPHQTGSNSFPKSDEIPERNPIEADRRDPDHKESKAPIMRSES